MEDKVALRNWLASDAINLNYIEYEKLIKLCREKGYTPKEALENLITGAERLTRVNKIIEKYVE